MRWTVVFSDGNFDDGAPLFRNCLLKWLVSWLKPGFRHCWAWRWDAEEKGIIVFDPTCAQTECVHVGERAVMAIWGAGGPIIVGFDRIDPDYWVPRGLHTCVSQIKGLLGIGAYHVLTPHQLYVYLRKREERDG